MERDRLMSSLERIYERSYIIVEASSVRKLIINLKEEYGIEVGGSDKDGVGEASKGDRSKVDKIINNEDMPDVAEEGKAYIVRWAGGRGIFACRRKGYLREWLKETGSWAEIVDIKYGEAKSGGKGLKVVD
jgi:hypothetical protein